VLKLELKINTYWACHFIRGSRFQFLNMIGTIVIWIGIRCNAARLLHTNAICTKVNTLTCTVMFVHVLWFSA